ncbi:MAG: hypothetical protein NVSMB32_00160 [Actinomycetota bacterium]
MATVEDPRHMAVDLGAEVGLEAAQSLRDARQSGGRLRLELLRGFQLWSAGSEIDVPVSAQRVVAFLALHTRPVARTFAAAMLWADCSEERAGGNLRSALWRANRPGHTLIDVGAKAIRLRADVVIDHREVADSARELLDERITYDQLSVRDLVLAEDLLPGWYEDWVVMERERFHQLRLHALEILCAQLASAGRFGQAIEAGLAAIASEPLRESAHRALIRVHLAEGNRGEALRQYSACRRILRDELSVEPSPATAALIR